MPDHIRYDLLTQQALRGVVRDVLMSTAKRGSLVGEHHFYISFDTKAPGVKLSDRMRAQYPEEMTVILQHQYWDLKVTEDGFEVGLSFGGVPEKLYVPFDAIKGFFDPSVQFGLQFEEVAEGETPQIPAETKTPSKKKLPPVAAVPTRVPAAAKPEAKLDVVDKPEKPDKPTGGGEVVRLDRFRKK
jgi:hypothetical protein